MLPRLDLAGSLLALSQRTLGALPSDTQAGLLQSLALQSSQAAALSQHESLLVTLHSLLTRHAVLNHPPPVFSRTGEWWRRALGFRHEDPLRDVEEAGAGVLALHNLIFFLANHPNKAAQMLKPRSTTDSYPSFPLAHLGIELTRLLALEFELVLPSGRSNTGVDARYSKKTSWSFIAEDNGFNRMHACLFLLLDQAWGPARHGDAEMEALAGTMKSFRILLAQSRSLVDLENRVNRRALAVDPDAESDYWQLPAAPDTSSSSPYDLEGQQQDSLLPSSSSSEQDSTPQLLSFFTSHMPSYNDVMSSLVPAPPPPPSSHHQRHQHNYHQQHGYHQPQQHGYHQQQYRSQNLQIV